MTKGTSKVIWGYVVEMALAGLIYTAIRQWVATGDVAKFISSTSDRWAGLTGVLGIACFAVFTHLLMTDFGEFLRHKGYARPYRTACGWAILVFFSTTVLLVFASNVHGVILANITLAILIYSAVNLLSLYRNTMDLLDMHALFRYTLRQQNEQRRGADEQLFQGGSEHDNQ